jgi:hypothetical protein
VVYEALRPQCLGGLTTSPAGLTRILGTEPSVPPNPTPSAAYIYIYAHTPPHTHPPPHTNTYIGGSRRCTEAEGDVI